MLLLCNRYYSISGACTMLAAALQATSDRVGEDHLKPGALVSDHAAGVRAGLKAIFPDAPHMQCWPHLMRKYKEGNLGVKANKKSKRSAKGKKSAKKGKRGKKGNKGKKGKKGKKSKSTKKGKKKGQSTGHQQVASEETTQNEDGPAVSEPDVVLEEEAQEEEAQEAHAEDAQEEEAQQEEAHADEAQEEEAQEEEAKGANEDGGVTKTHPHYKEIKKHLKLVHYAQTTAMRCSHYVVVIVIFLLDPFHIFLSNQIYPQFIDILFIIHERFVHLFKKFYSVYSAIFSNYFANFLVPFTL